jgi:RNA polymerase sigma factor (sigma-70 family)
MATLHRLVGHLRRWAEPLGSPGPTDRQLLERFAAHREEDAFAELVRRHGPMVLGVARRVLGDAHDAEDVFQAVFLVLARKAGAVAWQESVGGWLYPVVRHLAMKLRGGRERRKARETQVSTMTPTDAVPVSDPDLRNVLDEELERLPEHHRSVVVLCYLEGRTQREAAEHLGLSPGEVRGRLERARKRLRVRLVRRGLALSAGAVATLTAPQALAAVPAESVELATRAATWFAAHTATVGPVSARAVALARGVLGTMLNAKLKRLLLGVFVLGALVVGALSLPIQSLGDDPPAPPKKSEAKEPQPGKKSDAARKPRHLILLWMSGGPSQFETWDLKPGHENGGPFKEIGTNVKGVRISEHLPQLAKVADKLAIVRSLTHGEGDHARSSFLMRAGRRPDGQYDYPPLTSSAAKLLSDGKFDVPPYVSITPAPMSGGADTGYLSAEFGPLVVRNWAGEVEYPVMPKLDAFESINKDRAGPMRKGVEKAFELKSEKDAVRGAYGRTAFGQGCLLARRLVETGVPVVEVTLGGWDAHERCADFHAEQSKKLDPAFATLLRDLDERKLLDRTVIVWMGEFGRTPKVNKAEGRDHWPRCFSVVLAGGGIKGGTVVGKTSDDGTKVEERPVTPAELHATIYRALGIDPTTAHSSKFGDKVPVVDKGMEAVKEALR